MNTNLTLATLLGIGAALGACHAYTTPAPSTPAPDALPTSLYPKVIVEAPLAPWMVMSDPIVKSGDGPLSVSVPVRLLSKTPDQFARLRYRFIFLDATGVPIRAQSDWKYQRFEPQAQVFLSGNALDTTATDWRCEIQSGR